MKLRILTLRICSSSKSNLSFHFRTTNLWVTYHVFLSGILLMRTFIWGLLWDWMSPMVSECNSLLRYGPSVFFVRTVGYWRVTEYRTSTSSYPSFEGLLFPLLFWTNRLTQLVNRMNVVSRPTRFRGDRNKSLSLFHFKYQRVCPIRKRRFP